jgi:hypothetical protein
VGRGGRRGPQQLRFRALLEGLGAGIDGIRDQRREASVRYGMQDCYRSGFALFYLQDPSVLEFQRRFQDQVQNNNLATVFGVQAIPADTQFRQVLDGHEYASLSGVFQEYFRRLQRSKRLDSYQFSPGQYLVTLDGSEYFNSEKVHCDLCLRRTKSDGHQEYFHQIVQPALVHPDRRQVIPLAPEFIRKQDGSSAQDCEITAGRRAIQRIRADHPQLGMIIVGDSLYANAATIRLLRQQRFSFLLVAKPGDHKSLFEDIEGLRRGKLLDRLERKDKGGRRVYEWTNQIYVNADPKSPQVNFVQLTIFNAQGKRTYRCSWVTDLEITAENVEQEVRGARARWKIENEGFNTLKNQGYHLEHNFGHGTQYLSEAFFMLNLLAYFVHQILELVDELYQQVRATFSARVEFWNAIRATFRIFLFASWDQVLERMNAPPQPAFD